MISVPDRRYYTEDAECSKKTDLLIRLSNPACPFMTIYLEDRRATFGENYNEVYNEDYERAANEELEQLSKFDGFFCMTRLLSPPPLPPALNFQYPTRRNLLASR